MSLLKKILKWKTFYSVVAYYFSRLFLRIFHRRRMRCSTNIYLTALAVADIVNLFCAFILSLQHYPSFQYGHVLYWSAYGLSNWFHDASRMYNNNIPSPPQNRRWCHLTVLFGRRSIISLFFFFFYWQCTYRSI